MPAFGAVLGLSSHALFFAVIAEKTDKSREVGGRGIPPFRNEAWGTRLRGKVLPIGGLKERLLAAHRAGLFEVILPQDNETDVAEAPENLRTAMKLHFVENMDQVLAVALEGPLPQMPSEAENNYGSHRNAAGGGDSYGETVD